jgi:hypothetical protein
MQSDNILLAIIALLLGGGGVGGIGLAVNAYRAHKRGKIEDDGTLIERLNAENKELSAKNATHQRYEQLWMTQAFRYRKQIARTPDIDPDDMPQLWESGTPKVEDDERL